MTTKEDLESQVASIFRDQWTTREGTVVPSDSSVTLGNDGIYIDATVLYADLADSTIMVDSLDARASAEVYKAFLRCAGRIINDEGGSITAYDGDRIMAVFIGTAKNTSAVRSALKINWALKNIAQPKYDLIYKNGFKIKHVVGVDTSRLLVAKTGVRGANDLVWVGSAANYAAKMCALPDTYATYISDSVFDNSHESVRVTNGAAMWEKTVWKEQSNRTVYRSTWLWSL